MNDRCLQKNLEFLNLNQLKFDRFENSSTLFTLQQIVLTDLKRISHKTTDCEAKIALFISVKF